MVLFSNNLIIFLIVNLVILFTIFLFIIFSRKKYFLFFKKNELNKIENNLKSLNLSNAFKERIIEIYHFLNLEKDSNSIASSLKSRLMPLVGYSDIRFFYRVKASENLKEIGNDDGKLFPVKEFPLNFELKNNQRAEFYSNDIKTEIDWLGDEFNKCILIPTIMGQNFLGVTALIFKSNEHPELSSDIKNILHTSMKLIWHISNYSNSDLMENILIESGRSKEKSENIFEIGTLKLNKNKSEVSIDGNYVDLTKQEFSILELLATNCGDFVTPEEFLEKTWEKTNVSTAAVDIAMFRLRQKLSKYKRGSNLIKNKTGKGYILNSV